MSITLQHQENNLKISVLGPFDSASEAEQLRSVITTTAPKDAPEITSIECIFYDADHLPSDILELISTLLTDGKSIKIQAYHGLLARSLMRLGLPVTQIPPTSTSKFKRPCQALALAGSADSLKSMLEIAENLPVAKVAIFLVQHIPEDKPNLLDQLLKTRTPYQVVMPQNLQKIQPGTMYIAPPGHHMKVAHGLVYLTRDKPVNYARPSIDVLLESLAMEYGDSAVAVMLCGFGNDGVAGCGELRRVGALVLLMIAGECGEAGILPKAIEEAHYYDYKLPRRSLTSISAALVHRDGDGKTPTDELLTLFMQALTDRYGYDFHGYQRDSLSRRIKTTISQFGMTSFAEFQCAVLSDGKMFERFCSAMSVGVTSFFRHPQQCQFIRNDILPYLESFPIIKVWSAGCSTGEEVCSIAIMLAEAGLLERSQLFATDISDYALQLAKTGIYPMSSDKENQENYRLSGGNKTLDNYLNPKRHFLKLSEDIRSMLIFHHHSLTESGTFNEFQLIFCRNVMIYFSQALQRKVLDNFAKSLHRDGFLVLGPQDGLKFVAEEAGFIPVQAQSHVYRYQGDSHG